MKNKYLSIIRIIAVLFVVFGHSFCPYGAWKWIPTSNNSIFYLINKLLEPFVSMMPLLTFISGYLFYIIQSKYTSFKYLLLKKFERLIVPMLIFGILYYLIFENERSFDTNSLNTILSGYGILWYCNMLFLCFVIAYPITKYVRNIYIKSIILMLSFGFIYLNLPAVIGLDNLARLFFYFYLGLMSSELISKNFIFSSNKLIFILGILFIINYTLFEYNLLFGLNIKILKIISGNILRISFILFVVLFLRKFEDRLEYSPFVKFMDKNSFGCYVFHFPVLYFIYRTRVLDFGLLYQFWLFPFLAFVFAVIIAYVATYFFRKTKLGLYLLG